MANSASSFWFSVIPPDVTQSVRMLSFMTVTTPTTSTIEFAAGGVPSAVMTRNGFLLGSSTQKPLGPSPLRTLRPFTRTV